MGIGARLAAAVLLLASADAAALDADFSEGRKWFLEAGNTDLSTSDRNAARVKAWRSLWPAKEALERLQEEKPGEAEALESKYGEVRMMVHWLRKESPVGLLEKSGVGPGAAAGKAGEEEVEEPAPKAPPAPLPTAPVSPPAAGPPSIEALVAAAEEYEKKHRYDVPGIHARWLRVMTTHPDLANPLVRKAAERAGDLEGKLKDAYRLLRNDDPDALKGATNVRLKDLVFNVGRDLSSPDPALRTRAARTLGLLAHPDGCYEMKKVLEKEADPEVVNAIADALQRIGGARGAETLADFAPHKAHAGRTLEAIIALANRNPVDRRIAAKQMARFAGTRSEEHFDRMLSTLKTLGIDGVHGMAACTENNTTVPRLLAVIEALSNTKEAAVARVLSKYFQQGKTGSDQHIREAAMAAVKKLAKAENCGEAVVPHLLPGVRNGFTRVYTTQVLQEITGQPFDVKHWAQWSSWYRARHPEWKEDG